MGLSLLKVVFYLTGGALILIGAYGASRRKFYKESSPCVEVSLWGFVFSRL